MEQDSLQTMMDSIEQAAQSTTGVNLWMIIAIVELVIIIVLITLIKSSNNSRSEIKKKVLAEGDIDFSNLVNSSFNAEGLYRDILIKCHPDRFSPDTEKMVIANELSAKITKNKHDIKRLEELKEEAKTKLNIN